MSYPGDGSTMSNYGYKEPTPGESFGLWKEHIQRTTRIHKNHLSVKGDGSPNWPGVKVLTEENAGVNLSYFNNSREHEYSSTYDRLFHVEQGYDCRLHRDDRHTLTLFKNNDEECTKTVPVLSSCNYGLRVDHPLENASERAHVRIEKVMKGFYRTCGTGVPPKDYNDDDDVH